MITAKRFTDIASAWWTGLDANGGELKFAEWRDLVINGLEVRTRTPPSVELLCALLVKPEHTVHGEIVHDAGDGLPAVRITIVERDENAPSKHGAEETHDWRPEALEDIASVVWRGRPYGRILQVDALAASREAAEQLQRDRMTPEQRMAETTLAEAREALRLAHKHAIRAGVA